MGEFLFKLPDNPEAITEVIGAVPTNWSWVSGHLVAPAGLIENGRALRQTGFLMNSLHRANPMIVTIDGDQRKETNPDLQDMLNIMVGKNIAGFIRLYEVGMPGVNIGLDHAKKIAADFVNQRYQGHLDFYKGFYLNGSYINPEEKSSAECHIILGSSSTLGLGWQEIYRGSKEDVVSIMEVCQTLGLREYSPSLTA